MISNLIAATYAPMREDGSLNPGMVKPYGEFLKFNHIAGAFVNGSTGDFVSLSTRERMELIEAWSSNRPDDFVLVNHVGHTSLREAKELATHCAKSVDAIAALAPYYFTLNQLEDLLHYCRQIAASAPDTPFYYYHIPVLSGAEFSMTEFLNRAVVEIPNFAGIKFTQVDLNDFGRCLKFENSKYDILFGVDEMLIDSLSYGSRGWVGSTYNHLSPLYHELISRFRQGDIDTARDLQRKAVSFVEILSKFAGFNGAGKSFMKEIGLNLGPTRFPHRILLPAQVSQVVRELDEAGTLSYLAKVPASIIP